jgi:crossover junction endodeoxyribonuclease RusA
MMVIRLPFPAAELFPNRKNGTHWTKTKAVKDGQRLAGMLCTKAAMQDQAAHNWPEFIPLSLVYMLPDKRKRDADNMLAASKALLDGMAEALGVDDSRFRPVLVDWMPGHPKVGALVVAVGVTIRSGVNL